MAQDYLGQLGQRIRTTRTRRGISRDAVAKALGVHPGSVGNWERGDCHPWDIGKLAEVLGVSESYLRTGMEPTIAETKVADEPKARDRSEQTIAEMIDECRRKIEAHEGRRVRLLLEFVD